MDQPDRADADAPVTPELPIPGPDAVDPVEPAAAPAVPAAPIAARMDTAPADGYTAVPLPGFDAPPPGHHPGAFTAAAGPAARGDRLAAWQEEFWAWMKTLASAALYAIVIVTFVFQVARVEGLSMAPTLDDQDRLIVNKLIYRMSDPRRGDIVMLYYPLDPDKMFVKRVIAEEGDQVRIVDGRVYVNDVPMPSEYVPVEYQSHDDWGPQVIPQGHYFVMGDHRNNSQDSRHFGFVPKRYIVGKVQVRWWPVPAARTF